MAHPNYSEIIPAGELVPLSFPREEEKRSRRKGSSNKGRKKVFISFLPLHPVASAMGWGGVKQKNKK